MKPWVSVVLFSLLRLAVFVVPLILLLVIGTPLGLPTWAAALWAAVIGIALSLLFLNRFRDPVSTTLHETRAAPKAPSDAESDLENDVLDAQEKSKD